MSLLDPCNRIMIEHGSKAINTTSMEGLKALKSICTSPEEFLYPRHLGRTLVPRLNAPGRIGDKEKISLIRILPLIYCLFKPDMV